MKRFLWALLLLSMPALGQTTIFNCSSNFVAASSGTCSVNGIGSGSPDFWQRTLTGVSGGVVELNAAGDTHFAYSMNYKVPVNIQAFTASYTWIPGGVAIGFVLQNTSNQPGYEGVDFEQGAGCEDGFFQAKNVAQGNQSPNKVFAISMDQLNGLNSSSSFSYSNTQLYQATQDPCKPNDGDPNYWNSSAVSTSPVPLNSPPGSQTTTTGHTYKVLIGYDGSNVSECTYDVTAANGSCSSSTSGTGTYFQKTWSNVNIPSIVGGNTAYVGIVGSSWGSPPANTYLSQFTYTVNTAPSTPSLNTYTATNKTSSGLSSAANAVNPTFSPSPGSYSSAQSVTLTSSGSSVICYNLFTSITSTTIYPQPDNEGGCAVGTVYSGAISVSSTQTLVASAGLTYTGLPSDQISGLYTISAVPTLTLTASHETMEQGQPVPPLIYTASPTLAGLSCTGAPSISTAATSGSAVGNYAITLGAGTLSCSGYTIATANNVMSVIAADGNGAQINNSVSYPSGFFGGATNPVLNATSNGVCNMVGDGVTDNTSCLNTLNDRYMVTNCSTQPSQVNYLYFPAGTYLFTGQISPCGNGWTYWGDGPQKTIFRLAPNTYASTNTQWFNPSSVNTASNFREYIYNIGFDVGYGNPNAIPMTALMNNSGALRDVLIWVEDSVCPEGLNLSRALAGPALAKNVGIYGCADAIYSNQSEYNFTFDQITLEGQTAQAIDSTGYNWAMQHVLSDNTVPFYLGRSIGTAASLAILDSELLNGASGNTAIRQTNAGGIVYERGVTMTGYGTAISDANGSTQTAMPSEYWSGTAQCVFCSTPGSLRLPEQETPNPVDDPTISNWTNLGTNGANFASAISGSASVTAYAPPGTITGTGTYAITVPDTVNHLIFNNSLTASQNPKFTLTVAGVSSTPLVIDGCPYAVCNIVHTGSRTVVVRDSYLNGYAPSSGAGNFFAEDIVTNGGSNTTSTEFWPSQNVWARQLNIENKTQTNQFVCNGAKLWLLGYKTENNATISGGNPSNVEENGCQAEIFGHFYYPLTATGTGFQTVLTDSSLWDTGITFVPGASQGWPQLYQDTQGLTTNNTPTVSQSATQWTPAFYSYGASGWTGILAPNRAADWTVVGNQTAPATLPANCATQPASQTLAALNTAIAADVGGANFCTIDLTGWGSIGSLSGSILVNHAGKANIVINGGGASTTMLTWTGGASSNCNGLGPTMLCVWNGDGSTNAGSQNWANGASVSNLTQGLNTFTVSSFTNLKVGSLIQIAQPDPTSDTGNLFPCATTGSNGTCSQQGASSAPRLSSVNYSQSQMFVVTACGTSTFGAACTSGNLTLDDKLLAPNWGSSAHAWWSSTLPISNVVIQNISMDISALEGSSINTTVFTECHDCYNVSFIGNRQIGGISTGPAQHNQYLMWQDKNVTVANTYTYGSNPQNSGYNIDFAAGTTDPLAVNNISQKTAAAYICETCVRAVFAYNYAVDNWFGSGWQAGDENSHQAGDYYMLWEGNIGTSAQEDDIHGYSFANTWFRNYLSGHDPAAFARNGGATPANTMVLKDMAYARYENWVANILGTSGTQTSYQYAMTSTTDCGTTNGGQVYQLGSSDQNNTAYTSTCFSAPFNVFNDLDVASSLMRWANYDVVTNAVRECASGSPSPCTGDETGSSASTYPGLASPNTVFPASFIFASQPSWWGSMPWPATGPDVTGGNIPGAGGYANYNPAALCYLNTMGGKTDGSSGALSFNASTCYGSVTPTTCADPFQAGPNYSGSYTSPPTVLPVNAQFSSPTPGCNLFYTSDGSTPTCSSTAWPSGGYNVSSTTTLRTIACQTGYTSSSVIGGTWTITIATPGAPTLSGIYFAGYAQ